MPMRIRPSRKLFFGRHSDGGGLYLVVSDKGHRAWMYRATGPGPRKRAESTLGP